MSNNIKTNTLIVSCSIIMANDVGNFNTFVYARKVNFFNRNCFVMIINLVQIFESKMDSKVFHVKLNFIYKKNGGYVLPQLSLNDSWCRCVLQYCIGNYQIKHFVQDFCQSY